MKDLPRTAKHSRGVRISIAFVKFSGGIGILMAVIEAISGHYYGMGLGLSCAYYSHSVLSDVRDGSGEWLFEFKRSHRRPMDVQVGMNERGTREDLQCHPPNHDTQS